MTSPLPLSEADERESFIDNLPRFKGESEWGDRAIQEIFRLRADLTAAQEAREEAVHSIMYIRCIDHRNVPQYNRIEDTGAECPACEVEGLAERLEKAERLLRLLEPTIVYAMAHTWKAEDFMNYEAALVSKEAGK